MQRLQGNGKGVAQFPGRCSWADLFDPFVFEGGKPQEREFATRKSDKVPNCSGASCSG